MESIAIMKDDALQHAVPSVKLALEHVDQDDYFQQLLSIDSALQALVVSKEALKTRLRVLEDQGLTADSTAVQQSLTDLDVLVRRLENLQTTARDRFNLRARSLRKNKTGIMDLPNELLRNVFGNLRSSLDEDDFQADFDYEACTVDIQNIRLTHRKFLQTSSHLLVQYLNVSPSLSSLKRLENVMRHPDISQGQRLLRIDMRYYSGTMAQSLQNFAGVCHEELRNKTLSLEMALKRRKEGLTNRMLSLEELENVGTTMVMSDDGMWEDGMWEDGMSEDSMSEEGIPNAHAMQATFSADDKVESPSQNDADPALRYAALENALTRAKRILSSWEPFGYGTEPDEMAQLDEAALALLRGHERYRALWLQQDEILQGGHFARAIAAAVAGAHSGGRPNLWLYMSDDEGMYRHNRSGYRATSDLDLLALLDLLVQSTLLQRSPWWHRGEVEEAPQSLLYEVPLAICAAGVSLAGYKVSINEPYTFNLDMSQDQLSGLGEVAQTLKIFEFDLNESLSYGPGLEADPEKLAGFYAYLSAAIGRQSVPILSLGVNPPNNFFKIGPLLTSLSWKRLQFAHFSAMSVTIRDLRRLVGMLQPGVCLRLDRIDLTTGTWAEALDCLHSKVCWGSYLLDPRGAEAQEMDQETWSDVFGNEDQPFNPISNATLYITSKIHKNPLRPHVGATEPNPEP